MHEHAEANHRLLTLRFCFVGAPVRPGLELRRARLHPACRGALR
jgi:hypothetical protein